MKQERETLYRLFFVGNELCNILVNVDGQKGKEKEEERERETERQRDRQRENLKRIILLR